jgi:hypothetical protein
LSIDSRLPAIVPVFRGGFRFEMADDGGFAVKAGRFARFAPVVSARCHADRV